MKTIYLVRHAKSSWKDLALTDFDRPLNKRGRKDIILMGTLLKEKLINPDLILSSPAERAKTTAVGLAKKIDYNENDIIFSDDIYEAEVQALLNLIISFDESINSVMMVGHNPGLTNLNNFISDKFIENIPTCGVVALTFKKEWRKTCMDSCEFLFFEYPKKYKSRNERL